MIRRIAVPLAFALACGQATPPPEPETVRVLFVGNSLTYFNDLPAMAQELAKSAGLDWDVHSVTIGGASLEDHIQNGTAVRLLTNERWDVVVLQQGPSTLSDSRANLRQGVAAFRPLIEQAGGRVAMYEVWPDSIWSADRFGQDFDRVRDSYALAARDVAGIFLPAGEAWRTAWASPPRSQLYGPDGFHPSAQGTYLAALTIVAGVSGKSVVGTSAHLVAGDGRVLIDVLPGPALLLQRAADEAVRNFKNYQPVDRP